MQISTTIALQQVVKDVTAQRKGTLTVILFNSAGLLTAEAVETVCSEVGASMSRIITVSSVEGPAVGMYTVHLSFLKLTTHKLQEALILRMQGTSLWPGGEKNGQVHLTYYWDPTIV